MLVSLPWLWWSQEASREEESIQWDNSMWDPRGWFLWQNLSWTSIPSNLKGGGSVFLLFSHIVYEITADSPLTNSIIWEGFVVFMAIPSFLKILLRFLLLSQKHEESPRAGFFFWQWFCFASHMVSCTPDSSLYSSTKSKQKKYPATFEMHAFRLPYASTQCPCGQYP